MSAPSPNTTRPTADDSSEAARPSGANYRRLAGNTVATLAGRSGAIVLALALSTILFRSLGQERFGLWSLFAFLVSYSTLVDFGLSAAVERQVAFLNSAGRAREIPATVGHGLLLVAAGAFILQVLLVLGLALAEAWSGRAMSAEALQGLRVLPLSLALMTAALVVGGGLSGLQRMVALHAWRLAGMLTGTAAAAGLALAGVRRLDVLLLAYVAGAPVAAVGQWTSLRRLLPGLTWWPARGGEGRPDRTPMRALLRFGGVLQLATIGPMLGEYAFRLIVSDRFGVEYAGIFDLAARAAIGLRSLASALFVAMVPFGVGVLASADRSQASRLIRLAVKYTGLFILPSSALLFIVSAPVVHWWLGAGPGTEEVAAALRALVLLHALVSLTVPMAMIGRSAGKPLPEAITTWSSVAAGVAAGLFATPFLMAVVLFGVAPIAGGLVLWWWLARRLGIPFAGGRDMLRVVGVAALTAATASGARSLAAQLGAPPDWAALAAIASGGAAAVASTWALRLIGENELGLLRDLLRPSARRP